MHLAVTAAVWGRESKTTIHFFSFFTILEIGDLFLPEVLAISAYDFFFFSSSWGLWLFHLKEVLCFLSADQMWLLFGFRFGSWSSGQHSRSPGPYSVALEWHCSVPEVILGVPGSGDPHAVARVGQVSICHWQCCERTLSCQLWNYVAPDRL